MAIALVSSVQFSSTGGTTSSAIDTTGANLIVCVLANMVGTTITDSKSNTWTSLTTYSGTGPDIKFLYAKNPTVGTGHTFTTPNWDQCIIAAFSGADTTAPLDQTTGQNQGAGIFGPGSITPTANGALVVTGICSVNFAGAGTIDSSMTIILQVNGGGGTPEGAGLAYIVQGTAGAISPTWASIGTSAGSANIASFLAASGGGGTNATPTAAAATFVIPTPAITATASITATAAAQTWTIPTPTRTASASITATAAAQTWTIPTPAITAGTSIVVTAVASTWTVPTPTRTASANPAATVAVQAWVIPTPSVTTGSNVSVGATAVAMVGTIPTPAVAGTQVATTAPAQTWIIPTPAIAGTQVATTHPVAAYTIPTPAVTTGSTTTVTATAVAMVGTIPTPTFLRTTTPTPTALAMICAAPTPAVTASASILVTAVALIFQIRASAPVTAALGGDAQVTSSTRDRATVTMSTPTATIAMTRPYRATVTEKPL